MAQPANKRTPLRIDAFWDKPTPGFPFVGENGEYNTNWHYSQRRISFSAESVREGNARNAQQQ